MEGISTPNLAKAITLPDRASTSASASVYSQRHCNECKTWTQDLTAGVQAALASGNFMGVVGVLMQLRKVRAWQRGWGPSA